ncbi:hypothetical protein XA68_11292 [Ophiocordyceps unilateralis]|uniref:Uncharacterized protein n=1 Tax=Ophiocordyceps unilateralis TaxID=268505 RepID=A0A2A9PH63_OPHUN|nr:hypothetical protein XA68_11292 [Ophiocordyceps unilateralis]
MEQRPSGESKLDKREANLAERKSVFEEQVVSRKRSMIDRTKESQILWLCCCHRQFPIVRFETPRRAIQTLPKLEPLRTSSIWALAQESRKPDSMASSQLIPAKQDWVGKKAIFFVLSVVQTARG